MNEWQPIETAPKDGSSFCGGSICAYVDGMPVWSFDQVWWDGERFAKTRPRTPPPTHWIALPQ